jgi:hypothetical protein
MGRTAEGLPLLKRAEELLIDQAVTFAQREELANIRYSQGRAYGPGGKPLINRARAEFAQLAQEAPGRKDLVERLQEIDERLRKGRFSGGS